MLDWGAYGQAPMHQRELQQQKQAVNPREMGLVSDFVSKKYLLSHCSKVRSDNPPGASGMQQHPSCNAPFPCLWIPVLDSAS